MIAKLSVALVCEEVEFSWTTSGDHEGSSVDEDCHDDYTERQKRFIEYQS